MRLAHVTFSYLPVRGGADVYLDQLRGVLAAAGHQQVVVQCAPGPNPQPPESSTDPDVLQVPIPQRLSPGRRFWLMAAALPLYRSMLAEMDRLIVHYPLYCLPLSWHPGVVGISHGVTWDCGPMDAKNRLKRAIARRAFHGAMAFVANDTFFLREMGLPGPGPRPSEPPWRPAPFTQAAPKRWYIPNCVDTGFFGPKPGPEPPTRDILVPRNLYRNRGIRLAIDAFRQIAGRAAVGRLLIAGGQGDPGYRQELEAYVAKVDLRDRVLFLGSVDRERLLALYHECAVTAVPSLCGEGTSLSALESMACGTPVVATSVGGLTDLPCLHCSPQPDALAAAILLALERREELAAAQRQAVLAGFHLGLWAAAWRQAVL